MISSQEVRPAIQRLSKTRDGELVFEYLFERFFFMKIKDENLVRQVGQRDVMFHVKQLLEEHREE